MQVAQKIQVDIISDVVCPWCFIGYRQLEKALEIAGLEGDIRWHPYELNPAMAPEGEDVGEHIRRKYGATPEQSAAMGSPDSGKTTSSVYFPPLLWHGVSAKKTSSKIMWTGWRT